MVHMWHASCILLGPGKSKTSCVELDKGKWYFLLFCSVMSGRTYAHGYVRKRNWKKILAIYAAILKATSSLQFKGLRGDQWRVHLLLFHPQIMYRFPESLQADIRVHLNHSLFEQFEIFQGASQGSLRALATAFHIELFPHKHFLLKEGDQITKLYFIVSGTVDATKGEQSMVFLGKAKLLMPAGSVASSW